MTKQWTPEEEDAAFRPAADGHSSQHNNADREPTLPTTPWWPVDLAPIVAGLQAGEIVGPVPKLMARSDGVCLLYPGEIHSLAGEPETGKGWIALANVATVITNGGHVLYLDCEDAPASIISRLLALGAPADAILDRFTYVRPTDPFTAATLDALLARHTYELAVVDGLSEAYTLLGLNPLDNVEVAEFLAALARPIADTGAAVLLIDHVVKAKDIRSRYALGAQHKLAGVAVAYTTHAIHAPSRTEAGQIKVKLEKDRHGHVRSNATSGEIALVHITPQDNGQHVTVTLDPPDVTYADDGTKRRTTLMEKASKAIEAEPGIGVVELRKRVGSEARWVDSAVSTLVAESYVDRREPSKTGVKVPHYSLREYRQEDDPATLSDHV